MGSENSKENKQDNAFPINENIQQNVQRLLQSMNSRPNIERSDSDNGFVKYDIRNAGTDKGAIDRFLDNVSVLSDSDMMPRGLLDMDATVSDRVHVGGTDPVGRRIQALFGGMRQIESTIDSDSDSDSDTDADNKSESSAGDSSDVTDDSEFSANSLGSSDFFYDDELSRNSASALPISSVSMNSCSGSNKSNLW